MPKFYRFAFIILYLSVLSTLAFAEFNPDPKRSTTQPNKINQTFAKYEPQTIIVRFKPNTLTLKASRIKAQSLSFNQYKSKSVKTDVDALMKQANVKSIVSLSDDPTANRIQTNAFGGPKTMDTSLQTFKKKYPKRHYPQNVTAPTMDDVYVLTVDSNTNLQASLNAFNNAKDLVEYAQPNYRYVTYDAPDPYFGNANQMSVGAWGQKYEDLWGLKMIHADQVWPQSQGQGVVVAVVDTGVDIRIQILKTIFGRI